MKGLRQYQSWKSLNANVANEQILRNLSVINRSQTNGETLGFKYNLFVQEHGRGLSQSPELLLGNCPYRGYAAGVRA
jgi:hypothetical protein